MEKILNNSFNKGLLGGFTLIDDLLKTKINKSSKIYCGNAILETKTFEEKLAEFNTHCNFSF